MEPLALTPRKSRKARVRLAALLLLVPTLGGAAFMLTAGRQSAARPAVEKKIEAVEPADAALPVKTEVVSRGVLGREIQVTGSLKSDEVVTLTTKASGLLRGVYAREGDRVRKGELLAEVDPGELRAQRERAAAVLQTAQAKLQQARTGKGIKNAAAEAQFRQAQQTLAAARTRLEQARTTAEMTATEADTAVTSAKSALESARERLKMTQEGSRKQEKTRAELAVARAQAQVDKLKGQMQRREALLMEGAIAREDVENVRRDYQIAVAELNSAKAQAELVNEGSRTEEIRVAEEAVNQAQASLQTAESNRRRRQLSDQDVETAQSQVRQAEAGLESAQANLAQREVNEDEIRSTRAAVAQARADVRYYDELLRQTRVYSPVNGVVTTVRAHTGENVSATRNELVTLVATDTVFFEATAAETDLPYLRSGDPAQVTLDAAPGKVFPGVVREVIPVAESTNRSVRLRISVARPVGMNQVVGGFARATIRGRSTGSALTVPRQAVISDEGTMAVFVLENGHAIRKTVTVGAGSGNRTEILRGLQPGERVIVSDVDSLIDGQEVAAE